MSYLRKWGELLEIHKQVDRQQIVKRTYTKKPFKKVWSYWASLSLYILISVILFTADIPLWISIPTFLLTVFIMYSYIEKRIENEYKEIYSNHKLREQPFLKRSHLLMYILFVEQIDIKNTIKLDEIDKVIEFENIGKEKISSFSFINSPILLIILTFLTTLSVEYLKTKNLIDTKYIAAMFSLFVIFVWFAWMITDSLKSDQKKNLEICKALKWYKLDKNRS